MADGQDFLHVACNSPGWVREMSDSTMERDDQQVGGKRATKPARAPYPPGTRVELRNHFDRTWSDGFVVDSLVGNGNYFIARTSDGSVLPTEITPADVRRERKRSKNTMWWT